MTNTKEQRGCGCDGVRGGSHIILNYKGEDYKLPETSEVNRLVYKLAKEVFAQKEAKAMIPFDKLTRRGTKIYTVDWEGNETLVAECPTRSVASWILFALGTHHQVSTTETDQDDSE